MQKVERRGEEMHGGEKKEDVIENFFYKFRKRSFLYTVVLYFSVEEGLRVQN